MIGEKIRLARKLKGLSQPELAIKIEVSKQALSKFELNKCKASSKVIIKLANALDVKPEYFFRSNDITINQISYRKKQCTTRKEEEKIKAIIIDELERRLKIDGFFESYKFDKDKYFKLIESFKENPCTFNDIDKLVNIIREEWKIGQDAIENVIELLESKGLLIIPIKVEDEKNKFDACSFWFKESIPVIVYRKIDKGDRQRFSLLHEFGHLYIDEIINLNKNISNKELEALANRFAGSFLLPAEIAFQEFGPKRTELSLIELGQIKRSYGLSMASIIHRLFDLKIVSSSYYQFIMKEFKKNGFYRNEPIQYDVPEEYSEHFERFVYRNLSERTISISFAAETLNKKINDIKKELIFAD